MGDTRVPAYTAEDFDYAKAEGVLFLPFLYTHDGLVHALLQIVDRVDPRRVGDAFIASLTSRRLDLRSALGSLAVATSLPPHTLSSSPTKRWPSGAEDCKTCGYQEDPTRDLTETTPYSLARFRYGGVVHSSLEYAWFDLDCFEKTEPLEPTPRDRDTLRQILATADRMDPKARPSSLEKALMGLFPSNTNERRLLIEILGLDGILQPAGRTGFFRSFALPDERELNSDWGIR
ncbi:MAG: hypothetical protein AAF577_14270 [Pseudomonadota bacterium]